MVAQVAERNGGCILNHMARMRATERHKLASIELFTGAGGLAMGTASAGFSHRAVIEWNRDACATLRENAKRVPYMREWDIREGDVRDVDFRLFQGAVDLIAAGAPCQPFSLGGKHKAYDDVRNMFPSVFRAAAEVHPRAIIVENVKGLLRQSFRPYFDYVLAALANPDLSLKRAEPWEAHAARLRGSLHKRSPNRVRYQVHHQLLNAADFGVPQRRERVFVVAFREDLGESWSGLSATHSEDALLFDKWVSGDYWREHRISAPEIPARLKPKVDRLWAQGRPMFTERWQTVRDALRGLPEPIDYIDNATFSNHVGNPGARSYPGHSGSPLDEPAKTLKAGDHGVPGGENMLRYLDGHVRYFSVREAARLQGFPDDYRFTGSWGECLRQLGNAVPVQLARAVANSVRETLEQPATNAMRVMA
jgi:DNA (cytosine-5)-methyltransferase 1